MAIRLSASFDRTKHKRETCRRLQQAAPDREREMKRDIETELKEETENAKRNRGRIIEGNKVKRSRRNRKTDK